MRRIVCVVVIAIIGLAGAAFVTAPAPLQNLQPPVTVGDDLDRWLAAREEIVQGLTPLVPDTAKRIRWAADGLRVPTDYAVVYIHGFSATRQELAPVPELVATQLGANLFETRLTGHGLQENALHEVKAEDWLADAAEALAIGAAIGEEIIVIATSTGATLALSMAGRNEMANVAAIVMISPNFALRDSNAELLTRTGGPQFARLALGETRTWVPLNERQARFWSTSYPTNALIEMMRLVQYTRDRLPLSLDADLLTLYSPNDGVVDAAATVAALKSIEATRNVLVEVHDSADPAQHVLIGDILSPHNTSAAVAEIVAFLKQD